MTRTVSVLVAALVSIVLGLALIVLGLHEAAHVPYQPSSNMVTPSPYPQPAVHNRYWD
jgi:hypothetical protein